MRFLLTIALGSLALGSLIAWSVKGGDGSGCCPHCGCNDLVAVCKQVPVVTKVPKVEYSCKCGDICVPGRSIYCGKECMTDCDGHSPHEKIYQPTCGKIYSTVSPQKTTTMVEKCSYKCVVEYVAASAAAIVAAVDIRLKVILPPPASRKCSRTSSRTRCIANRTNSTPGHCTAISFCK